MASLSITRAQPAEAGTATEADRQIARAVHSALEQTATVPHERIRIAVADRWVTLTGSVDLWSQREAVERIVRRIGGVRGYLSTIMVRGRRAPGARDKHSAPRRWRNKQGLATPC